MKPFLVLGLLIASSLGAFANDQDNRCAELVTAERTFCSQVSTMGIGDAFIANMADECFLPDRLALTKSEYVAAVHEARAKAGASYKPGPNPNVQLVWSPSKVDVSNDGTLGYTWGRYDFTSKGKDGKVDSSSGIYLTIWKKQADGSWKFVYDGGPQVPDDPKELVKFFARTDLPKPSGSG